MKKLALFVMLLSLGVFALGCGEEKKPAPPAADTPAADAPADDADAPADEPAADAPAEEKTDAPAEEKKEE